MHKLVTLFYDYIIKAHLKIFASYVEIQKESFGTEFSITVHQVISIVNTDCLYTVIH